jgi:transcriptional regulator with XRE-family HTH domain
MQANEISLRIRELRKSLKLTQSQFAELVHMSEDSIGKIERGVGVPTVDTLIKIAFALKIPIEDLILPSKKKLPHKQIKELNNLLAYLQTRSPDDIRFIHELAVKFFEKKSKCSQ